jgi:BioD-like phosphotransacetylase family protein
MYYRECGTSKSYYAAIQVKVNTTDLYHLSSDSKIDTVGYIYEENFNPFNPSENLLASNDDGCGVSQFRLNIQLNVNTKYILVVSTSLPDRTGNFSVIVSGAIQVDLDPVREYMYHIL